MAAGTASLKLDGRVLQRVGWVLGVAAVVCAMLAVWASASANAAASVSSNWAGYAVVPSAGDRSAFSSISGSWTVPAATCSDRGDTYSAAWVGLGGFHESSHALEQIGTDADCSRSGGAVYSGWYELVPAAPITLKLKVHAGDAMVASVTVKDHDVTLRIRDLSTGKMFTRTRRVSRIDSSSAEWIVEAPSELPCRAACLGSEHFSRCRPIGPVERRLGVCGELGRTGDPDRTADPADAAGLQWGSSLSQARFGHSYTYLTVSLRGSWLVRECLVSPCLVLCETRCLFPPCGHLTRGTCV